MTLLRSAVYNLVFFIWTLFCALALLWVFVLPRRLMVRVIRLYFLSLYPLEKYILGLDYRVIGRQNLPSGQYIIAMKHQSAWETFKLLPLFGDVAIVLKRELMWIPLWGWYQAKTGVIPVNRGAGGAAMRSLLEGAQKVAGQGRSILIFPQGTRVAAGAKKPYKSGIGYVYETLNLPVVPVALNAGVFWPRNSFLKRSGVVTVEILPAIQPGLSRLDFMQQLEEKLEAASDRLLPQAAALSVDAGEKVL